jgi:hypothetical protein
LTRRWPGWPVGIPWPACKDWRVERGTVIWEPGWPGRSPGWLMTTFWMDGGGAAAGLWGRPCEKISTIIEPCSANAQSQLKKIKIAFHVNNFITLLLGWLNYKANPCGSESRHRMKIFLLIRRRYYTYTGMLVNFVKGTSRERIFETFQTVPKKCVQFYQRKRNVLKSVLRIRDFILHQ